jgi:hypothetical protein
VVAVDEALAFGEPVAPLLEEEVHARGLALVAEVAGILQQHWAGFAAFVRIGFAAADDQVDFTGLTVIAVCIFRAFTFRATASPEPLTKVHFPEEWLQGKTSNFGRNQQQRWNSNLCLFLVLDGGHGPNVRWKSTPPARGCEFHYVLWSLGEEEPVEVGGLFDQVENFFPGADELLPIRTFVILEDICHARTEDAVPLSRFGGGFVPLQWLIPVVVTEEAAGLVWPPYIMAGALGECFGVTVLARGRDFHAAPPWVEGVMGPFDFTILHASIVLPCAGGRQRGRCILSSYVTVVNAFGLDGPVNHFFALTNHAAVKLAEFLGADVGCVFIAVVA